MCQPSPDCVVICSLGRVEYALAWDLQQRIQGKLIQSKRQDPPGTLPHILMLVEHPPVYTLGKSGDVSNLLLSEDYLTQKGAAFFHTDRGGDITFHGLGQIVGYPLLDLDRFFTDIHRYLRELEETIILTCAEYGLKAGRVEGRTGVWIGPDEKGPDRKICAMGIRVSRWVTMHGFAFNVNTDLSFFDHIIPCGISDRGVTSLEQELNHPVNEAEVCQHLIRHFGRCFNVKTVERSGVEAFLFLDEYI